MINNLKKQKMPAVLLAAALFFSVLGSAPDASAAPGDLTTSAATTGTAVLDGNGGAVLETFSPDLDLDSSLSAILTASTTADTAAYYGVRSVSATTTGDVFWRIVVSHESEALASGDVMITEKGYFDATGGTVADSAYTAAEASGDLRFDGNAGWETFAGDDFTNVDEIAFDADAPLGVYTVTRTLIDNSTTTEEEIGTSFSFDIDLEAAAAVDMTAPVFATTTDIMATATTSAGVQVDFTITATDDTDADVDVVCDPASGSLFAVGTTTVDCTAEDDALNTATTSFDVIVELDESTTTPGGIEITVPSPSASGLFCSALSPFVLEGTADADAVISVTGGLSAATTTANGAGAWSVGVDLAQNASTTLTVTAKDSIGNVLDTEMIDVVFDTTAPTITLNGDANMSIGEGGNFTDPGVTVSDNLDANVSASTTGSVDTATPGTYTLTYSAADCSGNIATSTTRTVSVENRSGGGGGGRSGSRNNDNDDNNGSIQAFVIAGTIIDGGTVRVGIPNTGSVLGASIAQFLRDLRIGMSGTDVVLLQTKLTGTGIYRGPITGFYGELTAGAVKRLQTGLHLPATGVLDLNTRNILNNS